MYALVISFGIVFGLASIAYTPLILDKVGFEHITTKNGSIAENVESISRPSILSVHSNIFTLSSVAISVAMLSTIIGMMVGGIIGKCVTRKQHRDSYI